MRGSYALVLPLKANQSAQNTPSPDKFRREWMVLMKYDLISCRSPVHEAVTTPLTSSFLHFKVTEWARMLFLTNNSLL